MWKEFRRQIFGSDWQGIGSGAPRQEVVRTYKGKVIDEDYFQTYTDEDLKEFDDMMKAYGDAIASANED